jgi:octaprenyl-diphosphate synthase
MLWIRPAGRTREASSIPYGGHSDKPDKVREVIEFVRNSGGLEYAEKAMYDLRGEAFDILHTFPPSETRQSLEDLVTFVTDRKK